MAERLGRFWAALARELPATLDIEFQGGLADHDTRILSLAVLKGLFGVATDEPVSYVNAPQLAEERGLEVRSTAASGSVAPGRVTPTWSCCAAGATPWPAPCSATASPGW